LSLIRSDKTLKYLILLCMITRTMTPNQHHRRIDVLDGLRAIAVVMVMLYHYYTRWAPPLAPVNYYPYSNRFAGWFRYGYFGVNLFFIISGFVIFYTLEKSQSLRDFWIKRLTRLFPAMLVCSLISYFLIPVIDAQNRFGYLHSKTALDFLPSLTFTHPELWAKLLNNPDIRNISGVYWSLWVEVCFYLCASLLYFVKRPYFLRSWMLFLIPVTALKIYRELMGSTPPDTIAVRWLTRAANYFNFCSVSAYFSLGILFYSLFFHKKIPITAVIICTVSVLVELYFLKDAEKILLQLAISFFMLLIYAPACLAWLQNRYIVRLGIISYSVYLLHESIGLLLINKLSSFVPQQLTPVIPVVVLLIMVASCALLYRFYEKPVNNFVRKKLLSRNAKNKADELQPPE